jgi:hypothetical protein
MAARCVDGSEQPHSCRPAGMPSLVEKLLRLASFLPLRVALQLFLQLLVLYHLISALPDLFYIGFRPVEVPSHPDGYFHVKKQGGFEPPCWVGQVSQTVNHIVSLCARFHRRARS